MKLVESEFSQTGFTEIYPLYDTLQRDKTILMIRSHHSKCHKVIDPGLLITSSWIVLRFLSFMINTEFRNQNPTYVHTHLPNVSDCHMAYYSS